MLRIGTRYMSPITALTFISLRPVILNILCQKSTTNALKHVMWLLAQDSRKRRFISTYIGFLAFILAFLWAPNSAKKKCHIGNVVIRLVNMSSLSLSLLFLPGQRVDIMENGKAITLAAKHAVRRYSNHYDEWSENNSSVRKKMWVPARPTCGFGRHISGEFRL